MPSETGNCRASFQRWYYDSEAEECQEFVWGGCGGNGNRFATRTDCENLCKGELRVVRGGLAKSRSGGSIDALRVNTFIGSTVYYRITTSECRVYAYEGLRRPTVYYRITTSECRVYEGLRRPTVEYLTQTNSKVNGRSARIRQCILIQI